MSGKRRAVALAKGVGALAATAAVAGLAYQTIATARDARRYPAPGKLVDIGGHRLHLTCAGAGCPAVVLDAGLAGFSLDWGLVTPEVAQFTTVCAYDRAGYGWSDLGPLPRASSRIAAELHELLHRAGVEPPYVLVGHSFGGFNVRLFADYYPDEVAGMVLVDVSHEDFNDRLPKGLRAGYDRYERAEVPLLRLGGMLARFGLVRVAVERGWLSLLDAFNALPPRQRAMARALRYHPRFFATSSAEDVTFRESGAQARHKGGIGDRPLVVLTGTREDDVIANPLPYVKFSTFGEAVRAMTAVKVALHAELARTLSTNGTHIVTAKSGHLIQLSEPALVVSAIRQVVEAAQAGVSR
ncbi:MAG TPA: alpha/beta hydrolase [Ktedonobacterales bacterium]|nr:alpha/beta hydrolase [Ktedonobacterales bacterium]